MMAIFKGIIFVQFYVLSQGLERAGWPGYEYYPEVQGFLKVHLEPTDFRSARNMCHSEDALIASPWTPSFLPTINIIQSTKYSSLTIFFSGAGLRTGSPGIPMEPCGNNRCSAFQSSGSITKVGCNQQLPYACYAPAPYSCRTGYTFEPRTNQCYRFYSPGTGVPQARVICAGDGGHLAKISDETEKTVLMAMSDGTTFIENDVGGDAYRHLSNSGYSDYSCTGPHAFICEMPIMKVATDYRD